MKILFMGTPEFARASLENLVNNNFEVTGVITQPDKPAGRKMALAASPVKEYALSKNIHVYQPQSLKGEDFFDLLKKINPDIIVVAAYGKILPKNVLEFPKYGCINVHASLLPKYRGASPINAAIMNGEEITGVTIIQMDEGIDTGDIFLKREIEIGKTETFGEIHDKLAVLGGELLVSALNQIADGTSKREKQPEEGASYAGKITDEMCEIDWNADAVDIENKIRGLSPSPSAFTWLNGKKIKIFKGLWSCYNFDTVLIENYKNYKPGEVLSIQKGKIEVFAVPYTLVITELQIEGGKRMSAADFINGRKIEKGMVFGEK